MRSPTNSHKVEQLMQAIGQACTAPGTIYFTGGASAVLIGWRDTTIDMDLKLDPEPAGIFATIPNLKNQLDVNIELAAPDQFIPALPGWQQRSVFIATHGQVDFYHYDFYSQALAKIERGHERDLSDVDMMLEHDLIKRPELWTHFLAIEPALARFPSIDPPTFRNQVEAVTKN